MGLGARLRNPLVVALLIALVPAVSLAVWLGPLRHPGSHPTAVATPAPLPLATDTPVPTPLPQLSVADRLILGASHAYGRVDVRGLPGGWDDFPVAAYQLRSAPPAFPATLPVWRLRGFSARDMSGLAQWLGLPLTGSPPPGDELDPLHARVVVTETRIPVVDTTVDSEGAAIAAAGKLLQELGVPALGSAVEATAEGASPHRQWWVTYPRHRLADVPVGIDGDSQARLAVQEDGFVTSVDVEEQAVDGGSAYTLRDWHEAWAEVQRHHWADLCCPGPNGNPGGPSDVPGRPGYRFEVDKVFLYYSESATTPDYLVPYYGFKDSRWDFAVGVPALRSADVVVQR